jgi:ATP-dependent 26S proteasome regulatory subunit
MEQLEQVERLIRSAHPLVAIESHEEARVLNGLQDIADDRDCPLFAWSVSAGLEQLFPLTGEDGDPDLVDAGRVLDQVLAWSEPTEELPSGKPGVFVLKDFHHFMDDPVVLRLLRDLATELPRRRASVVLLSPTFEVVPDLEKDVALVDFALPGKDELRSKVAAFIDDLRANPGADENTVALENGGVEEVVRALQGLSLVEAEAALGEAVIANGRLDAGVLPMVLEAKARQFAKSGALEYYSQQATFADVGGLDLLLSECQGLAEEFSEEAAAFGVEPPRGFLLVGVPGCGKSLTAKAIAGGKMPLVRLDVGALFGSLVGQSEAQARSALKIVEAAAPVVLWLDEIEKALGMAGGELDGGTSQRVLGTILTWMEETKAPVFIVATANDISALRPELVRRFDETFFIDLPQPEERREILAIHLRKRGREPGDFDLETVVDATEDFTGAEMEQIVQKAIRRAFATGKDEVETGDLLASVEATVPLSTTMDLTKMRSWASKARPASSKQESGHRAAATTQTGAVLDLD